MEYLRKQDYAGTTVLRGIEGFGQSHKIHTAHMLELSTDLPLVVEIVDTAERLGVLMDRLEQTGLVNGALVTEETVHVHRFS